MRISNDLPRYITQVRYTGKFSLLTIFVVYDDKSIRTVHTAKMKIPYSVATLLNLAFLSRVAADVISCDADVRSFYEGFQAMDHDARVGYIRIIREPTVIGDSKLTIAFGISENLTVLPSGCFDFRSDRPSFVMSLSPIPGPWSQTNGYKGSTCEMRDLISGVTYDYQS
jgi:hypothetical protein